MLEPTIYIPSRLSRLLVPVSRCHCQCGDGEEQGR